MTKKLGLLAALALACAFLASGSASAAKAPPMRCHGVVQMKVVHPAGHRARTVRVCLPATKRLDASIGFGAPASTGFTVGFSFASAAPGPIAQVYDPAKGDVISFYLSDEQGLVVGAGIATVGQIHGLSAGVHRVIIAVGPDGMGTVYLDGKYWGRRTTWDGAMPSTIRVALGGWAVNRDALFGAPGFFGHVGTTFHGHVNQLVASPGIHLPA